MKFVASTHRHGAEEGLSDRRHEIQYQIKSHFRESESLLSSFKQLGFDYIEHTLK